MLSNHFAAEPLSIIHKHPLGNFLVKIKASFSRRAASGMEKCALFIFLDLASDIIKCSSAIHQQLCTKMKKKNIKKKTSNMVRGEWRENTIIAWMTRPRAVHTNALRATRLFTNWHISKATLSTGTLPPIDGFFFFYRQTPLIPLLFKVLAAINTSSSTIYHRQTVLRIYTNIVQYFLHKSPRKPQKKEFYYV